jgi:hypothetical protein
VIRWIGGAILEGDRCWDSVLAAFLYCSGLQFGALSNGLRQNNAIDTKLPTASSPIDDRSRRLGYRCRSVGKLTTVDAGTEALEIEDDVR